MKKLLFIVLLLFLSTEARADWDFYFFGINAKAFKEMNYLAVGAGVLASVAVHTAGHYGYAKLSNMDIHQEGLKEVTGAGYSNKQYRECAQAGFLTQHIVGLILTSIPYTRQSDFTKGYVAMAFIETATYPLLWRGEGDLYFSDKYGGNDTWEYIGFMALATHNVLRVKWYKDSEVAQ